MAVQLARRKRAPMTENQARSFSRFSLANVSAILASLKCQCQPYQDVFTFNRWRAQGYYVRKDEHGIKLPVIINVDVQNDQNDDNSEKDTPNHHAKLLWTTTVFCRCQVTRK